MDEIYTLPLLVSLATFILSTHITPGSTNIILLSSVLNFGFKNTLPFMLANIVSYPIMMTLTAFGMGMFLVQHPTIMLVLKIVGTLYLFYMAWQIARNNNTYDTNENLQNKPFGFLQGFIYPFLNPKAWIVYTSTISIYITSIENKFSQITIIVFIIFIAMIIATSFWSMGAMALKKLLKKRSFIKKLNIIMAILLVVSILPILF